MYQFWPDLQLPKAKTKMPWATAECDKIPKMGKIICFYVNTHEWLFCDFQPPLMYLVTYTFYIVQ